MGHIRLKPQTATIRAGSLVQGRTAVSAERLMQDAKSLEEAGVFSIVLDMITEDVARIITETVSVPTIGIGSGRYSDGQVLVLHDMVGLYRSFTPKFAKRYAELAALARRAINQFESSVRESNLPEKNTYST